MKEPQLVNESLVTVRSSTCENHVRRREQPARLRRATWPTLSPPTAVGKEEGATAGGSGEGPKVVKRTRIF